MKDFDDIDLLSEERVDNPHPTYKLLRENDPVHWSERLQGWLLTRSDDIKFWLQDSRVSANRTHLFAKHQLRGLSPDLMKDYLRLTASMIVMQDGAAHTRCANKKTACCVRPTSSSGRLRCTASWVSCSTGCSSSGGWSS